MTAVLELADRGLLAALAIAYDKAGHDRAAKLHHAGAHVGRVLTSTSELTADEARSLRRHVPRCSPTCAAMREAPPTLPPAAVAASMTSCSCATGGRRGESSPCDPRGVGRWCPPSICWCGHCPWWKPAPEPNYAAAIAGPDNSRSWR